MVGSVPMPARKAAARSEAMMTTSRAAPIASEHPFGAWVAIMESGELWLCDGREGRDATRMLLQRVDLGELQRRFPRLAQALATTRSEDAPRILREP